jgi:protein translocase SEC61 complex gamma subunit
VLNLLSDLFRKVKEMLASYKRVLIVARKPDKEELIRTAKICLIGMGLIGLIGFIIYAFSILFLA